MLFVELALIRWVGSEILDLSYFANFVLLGSFLGIGLGFLRANAPRDLSQWAPAGLGILVIAVSTFPVQITPGPSSSLLFYGAEKTGLPVWITLPAVFLMVAGAMEMIGEGVARTFVKFDPLRAYSYDLLGSLAGIAVFTELSFLSAPPLAWGAIAVTLLLALNPPRYRPIHVAFGLAVLAILGVESTGPNTSWSPYYKVTTYSFAESTSSGLIPVTSVAVNGIPIQTIAPIGPQTAQPSSTNVNSPDFPQRDFYQVPYRQLKKQPEDVLIIGAGTGNDAAIALARGSKHVEAVEIDPRILTIGRQQNPDHPYDDPRLSTINDDGRAFLERTNRKYDLILFGLPDSQTLLTGQSSLRLESYLLTAEALDAAKSHLKSGGAFSAYNFYRQPWFVDRLALTLRQLYGRDPCVRTVGIVGHVATLTVSPDPGVVRCDTPWTPTSTTIPAPATDDHPFPYLRTNAIPDFYLITLALIALASLSLVRLAGGPMKPMLQYSDLFFMGAAFLLLETKNVVQFALLFGTTWQVNALVFTGILLSVFGATQLARKVALPGPEVLYPLLFVSLAVGWLIPQHLLLQLDPLPRFLVSIGLAFAPIFIANLVFARRFRDVGDSTTAFGANLLGAMGGGLLEYLALVTGYRAILVLVAVLYALAFLASRGHLLARRVTVLGRST
jgi:SAM-dependent methyltransferase